MSEDDQHTTDEQPQHDAETSAVRAHGWTMADHIATLLLFVPFGFASIALFQVGALVGMQADVCGGDGFVCEYSMIDAGALTARIAPLGLLILAILLAVYRIVRQRIAFWVPLIGIAAVIGVIALAGGIVDSAITHA